MLTKLQHQIEAILFAAGEPIQLERIAQAVGVDPQTVRKLLETVAEQYEEGEGPFLILRLDDRWQMTTKTSFAGVIKLALELRRNIPLSQAALEVLAIIAYNQPVTRAFIEQVRGVDSSGVVNSLVEKGLVEEAGRLELPGRPLSYCTTPNFLRCFSLESLEGLPQVSDTQSEETEEPTGGEELEGQVGFAEIEGE